MANAMPEHLRARMRTRAESLQSSRAEITEDEQDRVIQMIVEKVEMLAQDMRGDPESIVEVCIQQAVASIDFAAVCPKWSESIDNEMKAYEDMKETAKGGNALAQMLVRKVSGARPELETKIALQQNYAKQIKGLFDDESRRAMLRTRGRGR